MNAIASWWGRWSGPEFRRYQIAIAIGLSLLLFLVLLGGYWVLRPGYRPLSRGLKPQDAAAVVAELGKDHIPFRIDEASDAILVPDDAVAAARLKVAELQSRGQVGLELFQESDLGLTEFAQKVNYQRALQGEIARTLMSLDGVRLARVHLTLPEASIFRRDQTKPKASVALFPSADPPLDIAAIQGIQRLVAASVPGMLPIDVVVLDQRGAAAVTSDAISTIDAPQFRLQQAVEHAYETKIREQLAHVLSGGASVSVNAELNFDQVQTLRENGRTTAIEPITAAPSLPTIVGNALSEPLPPLPQMGSGVPAETEHLREQVVTAPGTVRRLSVGIVLDRAQSTSAISRAEAVVAASIGLNRQRGDTLAIVASAARAPVEAPARAAARALPHPPLSPAAPLGRGGLPVPWRVVMITGAIALPVLGVLGLLALRRRRRTRRLQSAQERHAFATHLRHLLATEANNDA